MGTDSEINRRDLIVQTAGAIGTTGVVTGTGLAPALAQVVHPLPPGFAAQEPLVDNWNKQLNEIVEVNLR